MNDYPEQYQEEDSEPSLGSPNYLDEPIAWQYKELSYGKKGVVWYVSFGVVAVALVLLAVFVFKSVTFAILVPIMSVAIIFLSMRPPSEIRYSISSKGIYVEDRLYDFSEFRAFGVVEDLDRQSIILLPVKRFSPAVTLYFDEDKGERIVDMLGVRLSIQDVKLDYMEKFIRLIRL